MRAPSRKRARRRGPGGRWCYPRRMVTEDDAAPTAPQAAYDMALWQLGEQARANRSFDTKAGVALTVAAAFAGLFAASLVGALGDGPAQPAVVAVLCSGAVVLAAFGWTLFAFYRTVRPVHWARGPEPGDLIEMATKHDEPTVRLWIAEMLAASSRKNEKAAQAKATWFRRELYGAIAQGGATIVGLLVIALATRLPG